MPLYRKKQLRKLVMRSVLFATLLFVVLSGIDFFTGVVAERSKALITTDYYYNVMAYDRVVALTFDDGPDPEKTLEILEILKRHQVPATFFFLGSKALQHPQLVKKVHDSGYEIGNHTFSHSENVHASKERLQYELDVTNKIIGNITGEQTLLYRPPFLLDIGSDPLPDKNGYPKALDWAMDDGFIPIGADIDSLDWKAESADEIVENVISTVDQGHIVFLHDGSESLFTAEALDKLIPELKARDYRFETVSSVIGLASAPKMTVNQDLQLGMTDEDTNGDVTRLQTFLLKEGVFRQEPTGYFGDITQEALIEWQEAHQVKNELGFVGRETREKIAEDLFIKTEPEKWPRYFSHPSFQALEKNFQHFVIDVSATTGRNIPLFTQIIIVLVVVRLGLVGSLLTANFFKPKKIKASWSGGVSVVIPAYNEMENIAATIDSVLQSQRKRLEIIVVDDGSTDSTKDLVLKLRKKHQGLIRFYSRQNGGKAAALNFGISKAKYGVIVAMDGDTIFTPDTIRNLVRPFGDPSVGAVAGKVCVTESASIFSKFQHLEYVISQNIDKKAFSYLNAVGVVPGPVGAWRKADLIKLGGYSSDTLVEDQDMTLAMLASGKKVIYEPEAVAYTETPFRFRDFIRQRTRWIFGTIQCLIKYRSHLFSLRLNSLGLIVLPNTMIFTLFLPLLYPLMDVLFLSWLAFNFFNQLWFLFAIFILIDLIYALLAFVKEDQKRRLLLWLPLQRIFYRSVIFYVVFTSIVRALEGSEMLWNKVLKRGDANLHHLSFGHNLVTNELPTK